MKTKLYKTVIAVYHLPPENAEAGDLCREVEEGSKALIAQQKTSEVKSKSNVPEAMLEFFGRAL